MRTIKNIDKLRAIALSTGSSVVHSDGRRFNSDKEIIETQRVEVPKIVAAEKESEKKVQSDALDLVLQQNSVIAAEQLNLTSTLGEAIRMLVEQKNKPQTVIAAPVVTAPKQTQPTTEWEFEIVRDNRLNIEKIIARAVK